MLSAENQDISDKTQTLTHVFAHDKSEKEVALRRRYTHNDNLTTSYWQVCLV